MSSGEQARLAFELYAEPGADLILHLIGEGQECISGAAAMVDEGERVSARYTHRAAPRAFCDARTLDEPGRRDLEVVFTHRVAREVFKSSAPRTGLQISEIARLDHSFERGLASISPTENTRTAAAMTQPVGLTR